jgi:hypothetical protein
MPIGSTDNPAVVLRNPFGVHQPALKAKARIQSRGVYEASAHPKKTSSREEKGLIS